MDGFRRDTVFCQVVSQALDAELGFAEHQNFFKLIFTKHVAQNFLFVQLIAGFNDVLYDMVRRFTGSYRYGFRVLHEVVNQALDSRRNSSRKTKRLAIVWQ